VEALEKKKNEIEQEFEDLKAQEAQIRQALQANVESQLRLQGEHRLVTEFITDNGDKEPKLTTVKKK